MLAKIAIVAGIINIVLWIPSLTLVLPNYLSGNDNNVRGTTLQSLDRQGMVKLETLAPVIAVVWSTISIAAFILMTTYAVSVKKIITIIASSTPFRSNTSSYNNSIFGTHHIFYAILTAIGIVAIIFGSISIGLVLREIVIYSGGGAGASSSQVAEAAFLYELSEQDYYYPVQSTMLSSWVSGLVDTVTDWIADYGYPAVFAAALLETIFPPIPSEVVFPLAGFTAYDRQLGLVEYFQSISAIFL